MSKQGTISSYEHIDLLEELWKSGLREKGILQYIEDNNLPSISGKALAKYGQRNWNDKKEQTDLELALQEAESLGDVSRITISKTGYSFSLAPKKIVEAEDEIRNLPKTPVVRSKASKGKTGITTHVIIPDTQIEPGRPTEHLSWASQYLNEHIESDNVKLIHLGDHWNMGSLSSYDRGKGSMEGRRYIADIESGNEAWEILDSEIKDKPWDKHFIIGNHENRVNKTVDADIQLEGLLSTDHMLTPGWERHNFLEPVDLDGISYCLTPDHRVLNADLNYIPLGEVKVGDKLLAFDEYKKLGNNHRKYRESIVLAADPIKAPVYRITLESGKVFRSTADHRWLARKYYTTQYDWIATKDLKVNSSAICRPFPEWDELNTKEAGYLAGIFDGEGRVQSGDSYPTDRVVDVTYEGEQEVIQLATSTETFIADGYASHNCHYFYNPNTSKPYGGQLDGRLNIIGRSFVMGHQQGLKFATRYIGGKQQIGIAAGSFYLHEENYMGPQGTGYWRGIIILHDVDNGSCENPQFISIDLLQNMYA